MNMAAEALNILDRMKPGNPVTLTERDHKILLCAVTGEKTPPTDWTGRRKHIYDEMVLSIGNTGIVTMNARLMVELRGVERVTLAVEDGRPVVRASAVGGKITRNIRARTGQVVVMEIQRTAQRHGLTGTKWYMQRDGDCWRGTQQIQT